MIFYETNLIIMTYEKCDVLNSKRVLANGIIQPQLYSNKFDPMLSGSKNHYLLGDETRVKKES